MSENIVYRFSGESNETSIYILEDIWHLCKIGNTLGRSGARLERIAERNSLKFAYVESARHLPYKRPHARDSFGPSCKNNQ